MTEHESTYVTWRETAVVSALLLALAFTVLGANFFGGETVAPMDLLADHPGWREAGIDVAPASPHRTDILDGLLPRWLFLKRAIRGGSLPTWNPLPGGGEPGWQLLFNGVLTPKFLLFLVFNDAIGFGLGLLLQMVIAGLGTYLLARRWTGTIGAYFAAATFMLCGFNVSWMMWPHAATSVWIPWVMWAVARTMDRGNGRSAAVLALLTSCLLFGGFPAVAAYGLYLAAAFLFAQGIALRLAGDSWPIVFRTSSLAGLGLLLGILVAAVQILPSLEFLRHVDLGYRGSIGPVIEPRALFFTPLSRGIPHPETTGYAGILALVLALVGAAPRAASTTVNRCGAAFWTTATAISLMLALRFPRPAADLLYRLPGLDLNPNNRWLVIYGLAVAVLAGIGLDRLIAGLRTTEPPTAWKRRLTIAAVTLIAIQAADLARVSRAQNAVVPAWTFFPETSVTRWLQDTVERGQGVIAEGFITAGTLSSYGIREWFAHGFHTASEKAILEEIVAGAWASPTAALPSFTGADLKAGELFDLLSVRFFVTPCAVARDVLTPDPRSRADRSILLADGLVVTQQVMIDHETDIDGISVLMSGAGASAAGTIDVVLRTQDGELIAAASISTREIKDTAYFDALFGDGMTLQAGLYRLELISQVQGRPPSAWLRSTTTSGLGVNGTPHPGELAHDVLRPLSIPNPERWRLALSSGGICVLENTRAPNGAILVNQGDDVSFVEDLDVSATHARYLVSTTSGALLVRSARFYPGWKASVDGNTIPVAPYRNALQSIEVPAGETVVEWRYEPGPLKIGAAISSIAGVGMLFLFLPSRRRS